MPCRRARDDGEPYNVDEAYVESETDESGSPRDSEVAEATGISQASPLLVSDDHPEVQPAAEAGPTIGNQPVETQADVATIASQGTSEATPPPSEGISSGTSTNLNLPDVPPATEAAAINLDDPDHPDHEWEHEDLDFGDEPNDEYWDVWGCMHRFREFKAADIPDGWLANVNLEEKITLECMACFKPVILEGKKTVGDGPTAVASETSSKNEAVVEAASDPVANEPKKEKRQPKKSMLYECKECGVLHCWHCRRGAVRKLSEYRKVATL
jgi:hypothetical protein